MSAVSIPVSVGELVDKLTILELKQAAARSQADRATLEREHAALSRIAEERLPASAELEALRARLRQVNARLWEIEDALRLREARGAFGADFVELARSVYLTNDERSRIKHEINCACGSELQEIKVYARDDPR